MIGIYTVALTPSTTFAGGTCSDIAVGTTLDVAGLFVADTSVAASSIGIVR